MFSQLNNLLDIDEVGRPSYEEFRTGARTRAVVATLPDVAHRFSARSGRVITKLYKGDGTSAGSKQYQDYHRSWFGRIEALIGNRHVQQSLEGGVDRTIGPYAVLEFIEGEELAVVLEAVELTKAGAGQILRDILLEIWIPLWAAGLRFKDCHPGNFVLTPEGRTIMIDTEQMRKDADELLHRPQTWEQRDQHQAQGLKRLPRLVQRVISATGVSQSDSGVLRTVNQALTETGLPQALAGLGHTEHGTQGAQDAAAAFLEHLAREGLIE